MNIKEAGRYAKYLSNLIFSLTIQLGIDANLYKTVENHLKSKANSEVEDETLDVINENKLACSVNDLSHLIKSLIEEKNQLALAIETGKNSIQLDWIEGNTKLTIDSAIEFNKNLRDFAAKLKSISNCKSSETKKTGKGKKFNVEGNQVDYYYDIEVIKTLDFDKNVVVDLYKKILEKTDIISKQIDASLNKDVIIFTPSYSVYDNVEDVIEQYIANKK